MEKVTILQMEKSIIIKTLRVHLNPKYYKRKPDRELK